MKKIILCLMLSTLSISSFASHGNQNNRLEHMSAILQLTETQQTQLKAIIDKTATQRHALRKAMHSLHESTNHDIREILSPKQQQKFDKMKAKRKAKQAKKHHGE